MPRKPRFFLSDVPVHIVQRGHSRESVFFQDSDYQAYLDWLGEAAVRYDCALHAYVLMSNHIHLLVTPKSKASIGQMMQYIGRWYVPYFNHEYGTSGSIWEGRYKASLIDDEHYLLRCMCYIELNPVRANMVKTPGHYRWSSYRHNAQGKSNKLIRPHGIYTGLGRTKASRCEAYKALFKEHLEEGELEEIRAAWQTGTPLGDADFKAAIEKRLNTRVGQSRRGRPKKTSNT